MQTIFFGSGNQNQTLRKRRIDIDTQFVTGHDPQQSVAIDNTRFTVRWRQPRTCNIHFTLPDTSYDSGQNKEDSRVSFSKNLLDFGNPLLIA